MAESKATFDVGGVIVSSDAFYGGTVEEKLARAEAYRQQTAPIFEAQDFQWDEESLGWVKSLEALEAEQPGVGLLDYKLP